ncbi:MAG TPA: hypothetical protein VM100_04305, partial [Longimicrobiales bacterium]|nr:hypothetical protein [Longimicrobiales bacterium]
MRIAAAIRDEALRNALEEAAAQLNGEMVTTSLSLVDGDAAPPAAEVFVVEITPEEDIDRYRAQARRAGAGLVVACSPTIITSERLMQADEWVVLPVTGTELATRISMA